MKFKVGDMIYLRNDLKIEKKYGGYLWVTEMDFLKGKKVTIIMKYPDGYIIKEMEEKLPGSDYIFTDEMFGREIQKKIE